MIRDSADIMMVLDQDRRIRYASPSLRELLGGDLPPQAAFDDLVHPDDQGQLGQALRSGGDGVVPCSLSRADDSPVLVEAAYRDLRWDRLVQGFVVTMRDFTHGPEPAAVPALEPPDHLRRGGGPATRGRDGPRSGRTGRHAGRAGTVRTGDRR